MTERPILFSAPMVRAILAGTKTQTRRLYKPRLPEPYEVIEDGQPMICDDLGDYRKVVSRYGVLGDRLWVRETWCSGDRWAGLGEEKDPPQTIRYRADNGARTFRSPSPGDWFTPDMYAWSQPKKWKPSIFMPRWASRITLEVTGVRVERLQVITGDDARAEGIGVPRCGCERCGQTSDMCPATATDHIMAYAALWDSINGDGSWLRDPWVWVVSFKRLP